MGENDEQQAINLRQRLYLIADEMRGMATIGKHFAGNVYEIERAHHIMALAAELAALAEGAPETITHGTFFAEPWHRASPAVGVEAAVFDPEGRILLVRRQDNGMWAMPGGIAEIGQTIEEAALRELWEEAGLRGQVTRLLGIFDGRLWGSRSRVHIVHHVFRITCVNFVPTPGIEMTDARFFSRDALPDAMHKGHEMRVPKVFALRDSGETFFDPTSSEDGDLPMHQRPAKET